MQPAVEAAAGEDLPSPAGPELAHGFRQYLLSVGPAVLQLQGEDALLVRALDEPDYAVLVSKFLSDASVSTSYLEVAQDGGENAPGEENRANAALSCPVLRKEHVQCKGETSAVWIWGTGRACFACSDCCV
jgi:hypothetical protein